MASLPNHLYAYLGKAPGEIVIDSEQLIKDAKEMGATITQEEIDTVTQKYVGTFANNVTTYDMQHDLYELLVNKISRRPHPFLKKVNP